jgi:hemoglobin
VTESSSDSENLELSAYARLGGEDAVRGLVSDFVDRVVSDLMIGFFFKNVPVDRLKQREFEFAGRHLGGDLDYSGRPLAVAHSPHKIMGGQFNRRLRILEQTLLDHGVPGDIIKDWLAENESLRAQITLDGPFACNGQLPPTPNEENDQK